MKVIELIEPLVVKRHFSMCFVCGLARALQLPNRHHVRRVAHNVLSKSYWEIEMQIDEGVFVIREQSPLIFGRRAAIELKSRLGRVRRVHRDHHQRGAVRASETERLIVSIGVPDSAIGLLVAHLAGERYIRVHLRP